MQTRRGALVAALLIGCASAAWLGYLVRSEFRRKADEVCAGVRAGSLTHLGLSARTRSALAELHTGRVDCFLETSPHKEDLLEAGIVIAVEGTRRLGLRATVEMVGFRPVHVGPRVVIKGYWSFGEIPRQVDALEP